MIFVRIFLGVIQFATLDRHQAFQTNEGDRTLRDGVLCLSYDRTGNINEQWRYIEGMWYQV